jgi:protein N-terminal amidase
MGRCVPPCRIEPDTFDLLLLPEMCFTGYTFQSKQDIAPYLESNAGKTVQWAQHHAVRLRAWMVLGFPLQEGERAYNAMAVVNRQGEVVTIYKKHFLYEADETWATEGPSFMVLPDTEFGRVRVSHASSRHCI